MKQKLWWLPATENDYTPHILQKTAFFGMCALVFVTFLATNVQTWLWTNSNWLVGTVLPAVIVEETNRERELGNLAGLQRNTLLDQAATLKAEHMATEGYFAHYSPEGTSPWYWFDKVGYSYAKAGENLAVHFVDSRTVVAAWMESPTHQANIMNNQYLEIGVGTAEGEYQGHRTIFVVQLFGTPAAAIQPYTPTPAVELVSSALSEKESEKEIEPVAVAVTERISPREVAEKPVMESRVEDASQIKGEALSDSDRAEDVLPVVDSFKSTVSGLVPITQQAFAAEVATNAGSSAVSKLSTSPNTVLQYVYFVLGLVIAFLLLASLFAGLRSHKPVQVFYGVALLLIMTGLFYLHTLFTSSVAIAAKNLPY